MTDNVVVIKTGRLTLSRITYHCDLQQAGGLKIPLGVIAEIGMERVRGLGLIARTELDEQELIAIGSLIREKLRNPFEFLAGEFEWAWTNCRPGQALGQLANRHSESLFVTPPSAMMIRREFKSDGDVSEFARRELRDKRDAEFDLMLAELWGEASMATSAGSGSCEVQSLKCSC